MCTESRRSVRMPARRLCAALRPARRRLQGGPLSPLPSPGRPAAEPRPVRRLAGEGVRRMRPPRTPRLLCEHHPPRACAVAGAPPRVRTPSRMPEREQAARLAGAAGRRRSADGRSARQGCPASIISASNRAPAAVPGGSKGAAAAACTPSPSAYSTPARPGRQQGRGSGRSCSRPLAVPCGRKALEARAALLCKASVHDGRCRACASPLFGR